MFTMDKVFAVKAMTCGLHTTSPSEFSLRWPCEQAAAGMWGSSEPAAPPPPPPPPPPEKGGLLGAGPSLLGAGPSLLGAGPEKGPTTTSRWGPELGSTNARWGPTAMERAQQAVAEGESFQPVGRRAVS